MSIKRKHDDDTNDPAPPPPAPVRFDSPEVLRVFLGSAVLEPLDLLKCMYLNKATRRVASNKLNNFKYDAKTKYKQELFAEWIRNPSVPETCNDMDLRVYKEKVLTTVQPHHQRNFVILKYNKEDYAKEESQVAIFDDLGRLVAIYKFSSKNFYERYDYEHNEGEGFINNGGRMVLENSGYINPGVGQLKNAWTFKSSVNKYDPWDRDFGDASPICFCNYGLISLFHQEVLNPTEVVFILMHALSTDTRAIYAYTYKTWGSFYSDVRETEYYDDVLQALKELRKKIGDLEEDDDDDDDEKNNSAD